MRKNLIDILLQEKLVNDEQLAEATKLHFDENITLLAALLKLNYLTPLDKAKVIARQLSLPFVDLAGFHFEQAETFKLPEHVASKYKAMLLENKEDYYLIGMCNPDDIFAYDQITQKLDKPIKIAVVCEEDLLHAINIIYRHRDEISGFVGQLSDELAEHTLDLDDFKVDVGSDDAPVVKLLKTLFVDAVNMNASDIHIEPSDKVLRVRLRIDGDLQEIIIPEANVAQPLILRLKLMSGLDIAEKRLPQDGRFNINVKNQSIDVRLSTLPTQYGESLVMRILNQSKGILSYDQLGIVGDLRQQLEEIVKQPHGMILVTGPTGSGKTTTLYTVLNTINCKEKKIITVEDPIEYNLERINQIQIHEKIKLTFTTVLHSALRHDPDIIMIGEIRDEESTNIALRASMTGHLVLATLHTNDAASSPLRLISMGVDSFLVASSLTAVLAQRLVKRICVKCRQDYQLTDNDNAWLINYNKDPNTTGFKIGNGCTYCNNTGHSGRVGVYEFLLLDQDMIKALNNNNSNDYHTAVKNKKDYITLGEAAYNLAIKGIISLEEARRVIGQVTDQIT